MKFIDKYEHAIRAIIDATGGQDKVVHVFAGLLIWLLCAIALRTSLRDIRPLYAVFVAEGANEIIDRISAGSWRWHDTLGDVAATIFWPIAIILAVRTCSFLRK